MGVMAWCSECEWIGEDEMSDPRTCQCGRKVNVEEPRVPFHQRKERPIEQARWFQRMTTRGV